MTDNLDNMIIPKNKIVRFKSKILPIPSIPTNDIIIPPSYTEIDLTNIHTIPDDYPEEFKQFCKKNNIIPANINSGNGKALSIMLKYPYYYWNRDSCDAFVKKFNIKTKDSIQLFNKHSQCGIQTNSGIERGKLYIVYPYKLSSKYKMRKNFNYHGNEEDKHIEINKIKSTINSDYISVPNEMWQLGHKNPEYTETNNLVLQPPIQGKYRDNYIFIDSLTKIPLPQKLKTMITKNEIHFTQKQIDEYITLFTSLRGAKSP